MAAAQVEFGLHGPDSARLSDIAAAAGITRPSLLYYFSTKATLYAAVVEAAFVRLAMALTQAMAQPGTFEERFTATVEAFTRFTEAEPNVARILIREVIDGRGPGRALVLAQGVQVLNQVESFIRREGGARIRPDVPIRAALMQLVSSALVRVTAGELKDALWGAKDQTMVCARMLFFQESS